MIAMNQYDVMRLAQVLAIQAEIEGMKITNRQRDMPTDAAAYTAEHFQGMAEELRQLAAKHNDEL